MIMSASTCPMPGNGVNSMSAVYAPFSSSITSQREQYGSKSINPFPAKFRVSAANSVIKA